VVWNFRLNGENDPKHQVGGAAGKEFGNLAYSSRGVLLNEQFATVEFPAAQTAIKAMNPHDGIFAGWYNTCKQRGYTVFCLNANDNYCLYVDDEVGEFRWYTT
jgi:hypothetical protein